MVLRDGLASSSSQLDAYFLLWDAGLLFFRPCSDEETDYSLYPDSRAFGHNGHYGCSQGYVFFCNDTFLKMTTEKDSKAKAAKRQLFKVHILIQRAKSGHPFLSTVRFFPTSQTLRLSREPMASASRFLLHLEWINPGLLWPVSRLPSSNNGH